MTTLTTAPAPSARTTRSEVYSITTVLLLIAGGFVLPVVGWLAGVVMLWAGDRWGAGAKWLGTLVWPAVVAVPLGTMLAVGAATDEPGVVFGVSGAVGLLTAVVFLPWVFVHLLRAAR